MKYFKRYSSLLLASLLLLSVFSLQVSAIEAPNGGDLVFSFYVYNYREYSSSSNGELVGSAVNINPDDAITDRYYSVGSSQYDSGDYSGAVARFSLASNQNTVLFESGENTSFSFNGIVYTNNANSFTVSHVDYYFDYVDGTNSGSYLKAPNSSVTYEGYFANSLRETFKVSLNFNPVKDVTKVNVRVYFILNNGPNNHPSYSMGYGNPDINIVSQGSDGSILATIRDWLSGIYDTLVTTVSNKLSEVGSLLGTVRDKLNTLMPTLLTPLEAIRDKLNTLTSTLLTPLNTIRDKIGETVTNIINLPGKIWEGLQNALWGIIVPDWYQGTYSGQNNNLFWPTPEEMNDIVAAFDDLFGEVLGPLWNIPETVLMKYYNTFVIDMPTADAYLDVPEISLELVGERLVFGPYRIPLVPDGLASMADITKVLSAILCTFGFVSMVAHKIHSILKR